MDEKASEVNYLLAQHQKDIAKMVSSCNACREQLPRQPKTEMLEDEQESKNPFTCVVADFWVGSLFRVIRVSIVLPQRGRLIYK